MIDSTNRIKYIKTHKGSVVRVPLELLEYLEERFPEYVGNPEDSISKVMYKAGQRSVLAELKEALVRNNK